MSGDVFLRLELLDLSTLPVLRCPEVSLLHYINRLMKDQWAQQYPGIEMKPLCLNQQPGGAARASMPLMISLKQWINYEAGVSLSKSLSLSVTQKRALWHRFAITLYNLQEPHKLIRDQILLRPDHLSSKFTEARSDAQARLDAQTRLDTRVGPDSDSQSFIQSTESSDRMSGSSGNVAVSAPILPLGLGGASYDAFENCCIEIRALGCLLFLQMFRTQITALLHQSAKSRAAKEGSINEVASPRSRPRSVSDGVLGGTATLASPTASPSTTKHARTTLVASPRQSQGADLLDVAQPDELLSLVKDLFLSLLPVFLAIISFHVPNAIQYCQQVVSVAPHYRFENESTFLSLVASHFKNLALCAHHIKFLGLFFQIAGGKREPVAPAGSKVLERCLYSYWTESGALHETAVTALIPIDRIVRWFAQSDRLNIPMIEVLTSMTIIPNPSSSGVTFPGRSSGRASRSLGDVRAQQSLLIRGMTANEPELKRGIVSPNIQRFPVSVGNMVVISGRRRELIFLPSPKPGSECTQPSVIVDCTECTIYAINRLGDVKISNCKYCTFFLVCVRGSLLVQFSRNVAIHAATLGSLVSNCYDLQLHLLTLTPPIIVGDSRDIVLGPYDVRYGRQEEVMSGTDLSFSPRVINTWAHAIVCPILGLGPSYRSGDESLSSAGGVSKASNEVTCPLRPSLIEIHHIPVPAQFSMLSSGPMSQLTSGPLSSAGCNTAAPTTSSPMSSGLAPTPGTVASISGGILSPACQDDGTQIVLPEVYASAWMLKADKREQALLRLMERIDQLPNAAAKGAFLQAAETRFLEWVHSTKKYSSLCYFQL